MGGRLLQGVPALHTLWWEPSLAAGGCRCWPTPGADGPHLLQSQAPTVLTMARLL
jgi:hypothetical protein